MCGCVWGASKSFHPRGLPLSSDHEATSARQSVLRVTDPPARADSEATPE